MSPLLSPATLRVENGSHPVTVQRGSRSGALALGSWEIPWQRVREIQIVLRDERFGESPFHLCLPFSHLSWRLTRAPMVGKEGLLLPGLQEAWG